MTIRPACVLDTESFLWYKASRRAGIRTARRHTVSCRTMAVQLRGVKFSFLLSLFLGADIWPPAPAVAFQLPLCHLVNQTISLEKDGCPKCHQVETTICSGYCPTKDPVIKSRYSKVYQHVCTYQDYHYMTFDLPDCPPGIDPSVSYPVALSCHCGRCSMKTSDCTFEGLRPNFCMNDITFYY